MAVGFDDTTIAITTLTDMAGTSGITGANGIGLWSRLTTTQVHMAKFPTALSSMWFGFRLRAVSAWSAVRHLSAIAPDGTTIHCGIGMDATGHVTIYGPAGTVVATSTATFATAVAYYMEAKIIISDTVGVVEVRMDETVVVTFSGDTRNGAATTVAFLDARGGASTNNYDFDDFYLDDAAYKGDMAVVTLRPNGNGSSSQFLGSDGNSTDNYALVNETPPSMTQYVGDSVSGHIDLYTMDDLPAGYVVDSMYEVIYAQKSDAGTPPTLLPVAKGATGTTRTDTALPALSTTAQLLPAQLRTTDPDGNALTVARVNGMEVGVKIS
jgi:hypothetical protein